MNLIKYIISLLKFDPVPPRENKMIFNKTIRVQGPGENNPSDYSIAEFENLFDIVYFAGLGFKNLRTMHGVEKQCKFAFDSGLLKREVQWYGALYSKEIEGGFVNDVYIKWIDEHIKFGLYANTALKPNTYIGEYTGLIRRYIPFWSDCNAYCYRYASSNFSGRTYTIDASCHGNEIRFINHSNQPNCESIVAFHNGLFHTCIRTIRAIPAGTQLCYDYGNEYLRKEKPLPEV